MFKDNVIFISPIDIHLDSFVFGQQYIDSRIRHINLNALFFNRLFEVLQTPT